MGGRRWTEEEEEFLRENFQDINDAALATELKRTTHAIAERRRTNGLYRRESSDRWNVNQWSKKDEEYLKNHPQEPLITTAKKLGRTVDAVKHKRKRLGVKSYSKWTKQEKEFLEEHYGDWKANEIADHLGKTIDQVYNQARRQDLKAVELKKWTEEEVEFLERMQDAWLDRNIADYLDRTPQSVRDKKSRIGATPQRPWTEEEDQFLKSNFPGLSDSKLAEELDRTVRAVKNRRRRNLGLIRKGFLEDTIWRAWENLCIEIGEELYGDEVDVKPELENGCVPEMRIGEVIVEAKKTPHSHRVDEDVENYLDHCDRLEFWCLFGHRAFKDVDGVRCVGFDELRHRVTTADIPESRREELVRFMDKCGQGVDPFSGEQREVVEFARV